MYSGGSLRSLSTADVDPVEGPAAKEDARACAASELAILLLGFVSSEGVAFTTSSSEFVANKAFRAFAASELAIVLLGGALSGTFGVLSFAAPSGWLPKIRS